MIGIAGMVVGMMERWGDGMYDGTMNDSERLGMDMGWLRWTIIGILYNNERTNTILVRGC